jgi:hypothetical protein
MIFTGGMRASRLKFRLPRSPPDVTPEASPRAQTTLPEALGHHVQTMLEFSRFFNGVVGSCDHALTLTSRHRRDQSRVPSLDRPLETGVNGTMNPSDSRPARSAFAVGLCGPPLPDLAAGNGSLLFRIRLCHMPASLPRVRPAPLRSAALVQSVAFAVT